MNVQGPLHQRRVSRAPRPHGVILAGLYPLRPQSMGTGMLRRHGTITAISFR